MKDAKGHGSNSRGLTPGGGFTSASDKGFSPAVKAAQSRMRGVRGNLTPGGGYKSESDNDFSSSVKAAQYRIKAGSVGGEQGRKSDADLGSAWVAATLAQGHPKSSAPRVHGGMKDRSTQSDWEKGDHHFPGLP